MGSRMVAASREGRSFVKVLHDCERTAYSRPMKTLGRMNICTRVILGAALASGGLVAVDGLSAPIASAAPAAQVVYDSIGPTVPGNVPSQAFQAKSMDEFGDLVQLAPGPRRLQSVTVLMSSWGCGSGGSWGSGCVTNPGDTFTHPITLNIFNSAPGTATGIGALVTTVTRSVAVPYRPSADPVKCPAAPTKWFNAADTTCNNGFAFPITFDFPALPTVPGNLAWTVALNTTSHGAAPIGSSACSILPQGCGYDSLNVGLTTAATPTVGTDLDVDGLVMNSGFAGFYCDNAVIDTLRIDTSVGLATASFGCLAGYRAMARISTLAVSETTSTTVVKAANPNWAFNTDGSAEGGHVGAYVNGPGTAPAGLGSAELGVTGPEGEILTSLILGGTRLANITELEYSSYQPTKGTITPALQFNVRYDGLPGGWQGRLVFEPAYTVGEPPAGWSRWDTLQGKWWASNAAGSPCVQSAPCSWSKFLTLFPNAVVNPAFGGQVLFKVGSGLGTPFTGNVDLLTIGVDDGAGNITTTNYDFEPTPQCTTTCYVDGATGNDLNGGMSPTDAKKTIPAAIARVDVDGTVRVAAGSYTELAPIQINKSIKLLGPNAGISPNSAPDAVQPNLSRVAEATLLPAAGGELIRIGAKDVVIDGFRFTDTRTAGSSIQTLIGAGGNYGGVADGVEIRNNTFYEVSRTAFYTNGPTVIDGVDVLDNRAVNPTRANGCGTGPVAVSSCGRQLFNMWRADNSRFSGNVVVALPGNGDRVRVLSIDLPGAIAPELDVEISRNTIRNACVFTCISLVGGISDVLISDNDVVTDVGDVVLLHPQFRGGTVTIERNEFSASNGSAVKVSGAIASADLAGITITRNAFTASGVLNETTTAGAALCNWWGQSSGPASGQTFGPVTTTDPLQTSNLAGTCGVPVPAPPVPAPPVPAPPVPAPPAPVPSVPSAGPDYVPVTPSRLFDTRPGTPPALRTVAKQQVGPTVTLEVQVTDLPGALVPATGVGAVSLNVTATNAGQNGFVTATPCISNGESSSLNFPSATDRANLVILPVSARGTVCFSSSTPVDIVVDVNGWFRADAGFVPVTPTRVFDTRQGTPAALRAVAKQLVGPLTPLRLKLTDLPGGLVPASGVGAVSLNVTATGSSAAGFVTVTACGPVGEVSNVNFQANTDVANAVLTPVSRAGEVCFVSNVDVHVVVDVNGWLKMPSGFTPVTPTRVFDTRPGTPAALRAVTKQQVGPTSPLKVRLADLLGGIVPASGVGAVSLTVTATGSAQRGFVTVTPCGPVGEASSVNFQAGTATANAVLTPLSSAGEVCFTADVPVDVVVDVSGWFAS